MHKNYAKWIKSVLMMLLLLLLDDYVYVPICTRRKLIETSFWSCVFLYIKRYLLVKLFSFSHSLQLNETVPGIQRENVCTLRYVVVDGMSIARGH